MLQRIRSAIKSMSPVEIFLGVLFALQILYLIDCNLFHMADGVEADLAKTMVHVIEMGKHRTFLLPNWSNMSNAEFDHTAAPSVFLYILTKNIYLSFGITNIVNIFFWIAVLYFLLSLLGFERIYKLFLLTVIFNPFDWGNVWYTVDMLFYNSGWFVYRVLIPIFLLALLSLPEEKRRSKGNLAAVILLSFMILITAISSSLYVFMCALAPVILCHLIFTLAEQRAEKYTIALLSLCTALSVLGVLICSLLQINPKTDTMMLRSVSEIQNPLFQTFFMLLEVWHTFPLEPVSIYSFAGIAGAVKIVFVGVLLMLGFANIPRAFGLSLLRRAHAEPIAPYERVRVCLISVFLWNYLILFLTKSTSRYHLIGTIPLVIAALYTLRDVLEQCAERIRPLVKHLCFFMAGACLLIIAVMSVTDTFQGRFHKRDGTVAFSRELSSCLDDYAVDTVFILNNDDLPEYMRLYDQKRLYMLVTTPNMYPESWLYYASASDRAAYADRNVILAEEEAFAECPQYIRDGYTRLERTFYLETPERSTDYCVYISDQNPIDGVAGIPDWAFAIDLPVSPGYYYRGEIDTKGYLHSAEEECILESPVLKLPDRTAFRIEIDYETEETDTEFMIEMLKDGEIDSLITLDGTEDAYAIELSAPGEYQFRVHKYNDRAITIGQIRFIRL